MLEPYGKGTHVPCFKCGRKIFITEAEVTTRDRRRWVKLTCKSPGCVARDKPRRAGVQSLREGTTVDQVFEAWRSELLNHRSSAKTSVAQHAIDKWSKRENVPFWGPHTINLDAGNIDGPLRTGMTIAFEPIAEIGGQDYYLEDMFLITRNGAELLTPRVPYSAEEIEAAMR